MAVLCGLGVVTLGAFPGLGGLLGGYLGAG
jgi:hypothetical protein